MHVSCDLVSLQHLTRKREELGSAAQGNGPFEHTLLIRDAQVLHPLKRHIFVYLRLAGCNTRNRYDRPRVYLIRSRYLIRWGSRNNLPVR